MSANTIRIVFLDTETTGLDAANGDRVVEVGCVEMINRRLSGRQFHRYLNPERASSAEAQRVHGLADEFLAGQPRFAEVAAELLAFVAGAEVVMHNAAFDVGFLNAELERSGLPPLAAHVARITDSLSLAREMYPGKANSLDALCKRLEVDASGRTVHGALLDAGLLAEVYVRMTRGQELLVMDSGTQAIELGDHEPADLSQFDLPLTEPSAEEAAAHEAMLADLDKASGGRTLWRTLLA